jgi:membrane-associated phospholipid phosphatase
MRIRSLRVALVGIAVTAAAGLVDAPHCLASDEHPNQVLEWNQILIDTLIATNTANSSSQRLGAIVHTAMFDAYNGIERRYTPIHVHDTAPRGASRRAAVIAAAHTTLAALFPTRVEQLKESYRASLEALSDDGGDGGESRARGIAWGEQVAQAVLDWRANDGFSDFQSPFTGGLAVGQWRPTPRLTPPPPTCGSMSAQGLAYTVPFVLVSNTQFQPGPPRGLTSSDYGTDFNAVKMLGRGTGSTRTIEQTALAPFWEGNASVHWNQAANQIARANDLSLSDSSRLLAILNIAMADTAFTIWKAKRSYGEIAAAVTWRPATAIPLAGLDGNFDTDADTEWTPLVNTPCHPEYPAGHPSMNGAAATVLLSYFDDRQVFTLTTGLTSRTYTSISLARSEGNDARVWGGMHYPSTVAISDGVGEAVATYVRDNAVQSVHGQH